MAGAAAGHDPGKTVFDLAVAIALSGDCLADVAVVRAPPELFGPLASDPTVSRLLDSLSHSRGERLTPAGPNGRATYPRHCARLRVSVDSVEKTFNRRSRMIPDWCRF